MTEYREALVQLEHADNRIGRLKAENKRMREGVAYLEAERNSQAARITELEAMLTRLEWAGGMMQRSGMSVCPMCYAPHAGGHDEDCKLAALLPEEATDD